MREAVGLFDVSHMGEVYLRGPRVREADRAASPRTRSRRAPGRQGRLHAALPAERRHRRRLHLLQGTPTRSSSSSSTRRTPRRTSSGSASSRRSLCEIADVSDERVADRRPGAQGRRDGRRASPAARSPASPASRSPTPTVAGVPCIAARTGYTGEDGFELCCVQRARAAAVGRPARGGDAARRPADRPGRARLAAPRGAAAALRQRPRRRSHRRSRPASAGPSSSTAATSSAPTRSAGRSRPASQRKLAGFRIDEGAAGDRPPRLPDRRPRHHRGHRR